MIIVESKTLQQVIPPKLTQNFFLHKEIITTRTPKGTKCSFWCSIKNGVPTQFFQSILFFVFILIVPDIPIPA